MLSNIIPYLNIQLDTLGYFAKIWELCDQFEKDDKRTVQQYCGNGKFKMVSEWSNNQGTSYWRKTGDIRIAASDTDTMVACDRLLTVTIPLRFVGVIPKNRLPEDDAYSADRMAMTILTALSGSGASLKSILKSRKVTFNVGTISDTIYKTEFSGEIPFDFVCVGIDMDIEILINQSCLVNECDYND